MRYKYCSGVQTIYGRVEIGLFHIEKKYTSDSGHMSNDFSSNSIIGVRDFSAGPGRREEFGTSGTQHPIHLGFHKKNPVEHFPTTGFLSHSAPTVAQNYGRMQVTGRSTDIVGVGGLNIGKFGTGNLFPFFWLQLSRIPPSMSASWISFFIVLIKPIYCCS